MNNILTTTKYQQSDDSKRDTIHVSFGRSERYLYEWLMTTRDLTPFTMSGLIKRMIVNDYRRTRHSTKSSNLYPINIEATGF